MQKIQNAMRGGWRKIGGESRTATEMSRVYTVRPGSAISVATQKVTCRISGSRRGRGRVVKDDVDTECEAGI